MDDRALRRAGQTVLREIARDPAYAHTSHLLITAGGRTVLDQHLRGPLVADVFSVTKTVLGTLCGTAVQHGHLTDLDTRVADVLPELSDTVAAGHTVRHLLSMTRGAQTDGAWDADAMTALPTGQLRHIADAPQLVPPGSRFAYDNGGVHLLAAVLEHRVPGGLATFAERALFSPLGIPAPGWRTDDAGVPYGHAHLELSAASLARLGQLWLQDGRWADAQLVDHAFLDALRTPTSEGGPPELLPYGYLCWLDHGDLLAGGWAGQHVLVRRRDGVVVVVTGDPGFRFGPPPEDDLPVGWRPALELVRRHLLPVLDGPRRQ